MSRDDNKNELTVISNWWFNIDKHLLICFLLLSFVGLNMSFTIKPGGLIVNQVSIFNAFTIQSAYLLFGVLIFGNFPSLRSFSMLGIRAFDLWPGPYT